MGLLNLAHATFGGIGAYTSALLVMRLGLPFWISVICAGLVAVLIAVVIGIPVLRLKGLYFIIITGVFAEVARLFWTWQVSIFGGINGIMNIPPPDPFFGIAFTSKTTYFYLIYATMVISLLIMNQLEKSRYGITFHAISQSDSLVESVGVNLMKHKVLCFATSCFFASVGGTFYAHYIQYINPEAWTIWQTILYQIMATIGGVGSIVGSVIGGVFLTVLSEVLRAVKQYEPLVYSALLILIIMFMPKGIISFPKRIFSLFWHQSGE
jgi:branched-chain amino acid transport system permease protein